ncbi:MAG: hypothetical protein WC655_19230 [Candidatus Hydrogenedentales bacterium]|jgi:hypothetical protein
MSTLIERFNELVRDSIRVEMLAASVKKQGTAEDVQVVLEAAEGVQRRADELRRELRGVMLLAERAASAALN